MSNSIIRLLVHAKQQNKWIPKNVLTMYNISSRTIQHLEDEGFLLFYHCSDRGTLVKLTLKGYKHFSNQEPHIELQN